MPKMKKVLISLPETLLNQTDECAKSIGISRSAFLRKSVESYLHDITVKQLEDGYRSMSEINSEWAEACLEADNHALLGYEEKLSESE